MAHRFDHPAWVTAASTAAAYLALLLVMFVALFLLPYAAFVLLGA